MDGGLSDRRADDTASHAWGPMRIACEAVIRTVHMALPWQHAATTWSIEWRVHAIRTVSSASGRNNLSVTQSDGGVTTWTSVCLLPQCDDNDANLRAVHEGRMKIDVESALK